MTDLLSLSWLHAQHDLDLRTVVPADPDRGFSVIQPTELTDPREFLQPDAVVLTVGVALSREDGGTGRPPGTPGTADADTGDTTDPFPGYVARLAEAQVAAVGFGTGLFYPEVPHALVTAARAHGIAVFEVPRHTAFISVLNTVAEERARRAGRAQERLIAVQEQLSGAAVRGGLDALLTDTASHLAGAVAVTDDDGRVQGRVDRTVHPVTGHGVLLCAVDAAKGRTRSSAGQTGTGTDTRWRITQRMTRQGSRVHFITVLADHPFTPHDRSVLKHAAGLADILLQRPGYLRRERTELNSLALRLQLGLETTGFSTGQVLDQAADGDGRVRPTVVAADRVADQRRALTAADRRTAQDGRHLFTTELDTSTRLFLFRGSRTVDEIAATFGTAARRVRISVGEPVAWDDVSLDRVRRLETAARSLTPGSVAGPYEAGADWLSDTAVRTALDRRATETVDRLLTEGGADGTGGSDGSGGGRDLLQTLETWLRSGGRTGTAADLLGVHRHTVRTRLARIAGILEVDLDDPVVRAELLLVTVTRP